VLGFLAAAGLGACEQPGERVVIAATTSTYDSGLLETLVAEFEAESAGSAGQAYNVKVVIVGSGEALTLGRHGDVDALLVHSPEAEARFVMEGHAEQRIPVMYNDFVLVGPAEDPARVRLASSASAALAAIRDAHAEFLSRGDSSGTHIRELTLWSDAAVQPEDLHRVDAPRRPGNRIRGASAAAQAVARNRWYRETGQGQGESLQIAAERQAYTLTDRATFLTMRSGLDLEILFEGDPRLVNMYSVLVMTDAAHPAAAHAFARWLTSDAGRRAIERFGRGEFDSPLFRPTP
jgi:tungstate transport system substrate-binding protein